MANPTSKCSALKDVGRMSAIAESDVADLWTRIESAGPLTQRGLAGRGWDDDSSERWASQRDRRRSFVAFYSWSVPSRQAIAAIATFVADRQLLEVCAGSGLWARLLLSVGVNVTATDDQPAREGDYFPVEVGDAEASVRSHPECRALMLCWPPFRDRCAYRALRAFTGDRVIVIGDVKFIGDERFQQLLEQEWALVERIALPCWPGYEDGVRLYMRETRS